MHNLRRRKLGYETCTCEYICAFYKLSKEGFDSALLCIRYAIKILSQRSFTPKMWGNWKFYFIAWKQDQISFLSAQFNLDNISLLLSYLLLFLTLNCCLHFLQLCRTHCFFHLEFFSAFCFILISFFKSFWNCICSRVILFSRFCQSAVRCLLYSQYFCCSVVTQFSLLILQ